MDHDALFKWLLKDPVILTSFFEEFLPEIARYTDFSKLEYLDKEMRTLRGQRRTGDLLVKVRFRAEEAAFLIHIEHEARRDKDIAWRLLEYVILDRRESGLPVYPVLVLAGQAGPAPQRPVRMEFPDRRVLTFDFPVIELVKLDGHDYVCKQNPAALALSARMRFRKGERENLIVDFAAAMAKSPVGKTAAQRAIRYFFVYRQLEQNQGLKVRQDVSKLSPEMISEKELDRFNPFVRIGEKRGIRQGRQTEGTALVLRQLRRRLGPLSEDRRRAIERLPLRKIEALGEALLDFDSPDDLSRWLQKNATPFTPCKTAKVKLRSGRR